MIREEYQVSEGMKIADIDPRKEQKKTAIPFLIKQDA